MAHRVGLAKPLLSFRKAIFWIAIGLATIVAGFIPWSCGGSLASSKPTLPREEAMPAQEVVAVDLEPSRWVDVVSPWNRYEIIWDTPDDFIELWFDGDKGPISLKYGNPVNLGCKSRNFKCRSATGGQLKVVKLLEDKPKPRTK